GRDVRVEHHPAIARATGRFARIRRAAPFHQPTPVLVLRGSRCDGIDLRAVLPTAQSRQALVSGDSLHDVLHRGAGVAAAVGDGDDPRLQLGHPMRRRHTGTHQDSRSGRLARSRTRVVTIGFVLLVAGYLAVPGMWQWARAAAY